MSSFISVFAQIAPKVFGVGMVPSGGDALGCTRGRGALAAIIGIRAPVEKNLNSPYSVFALLVVQIAPLKKNYCVHMIIQIRVTERMAFK